MGGAHSPLGVSGSKHDEDQETGQQGLGAPSLASNDIVGSVEVVGSAKRSGKAGRVNLRAAQAQAVTNMGATSMAS